MWIDLPEWPKIIKIFTSQVNIHQIVRLAEEDFNNQVDRMTYTVDTSQPLSSASYITIITQCAHERWPWWQGCRLHIGSTAWTFIHPMLSALSASHRDQHNGTLSQGHQQPAGGKFLTVKHFHDRRTLLCPHWKTLTLGMNLPSLRFYFAVEHSLNSSQTGLHSVPQYTPQILSSLVTLHMFCLSGTSFCLSCRASCWLLFRSQLVHHILKEAFLDHTIKIIHL